MASNGPEELVRAVWEDNVDQVTELLQNGLDINAKNDHGDNPLDIATNKGNIAMMTMLLEKGADVNLPDDDGWYALHTATRHGTGIMVELLMKHGAMVNVDSPNKTTPLCLAVRYGTLEMVALLLQAEAEVNVVSLNGWSPLHLAIRYSTEEVVKLLISHGADIEKQTDEGWSAVHLAAQYNTLDTVKMLADNGADVTSQGQNNATALHLAALDASVDMVELLLSLGANIDAHDENEYTAIMHAAFQSQTDKVQLLIKHKCKLHLQNNQGWTVLHIAATYANPEIVKMLLDAGATHVVEVLDQKGNTALHHAIESGTLEIMKLLLEYTEDINCKGALGWTSLHHAACYANVEKMQVLIAKGADLNPRPIDKSSTPLHVAAIYGTPAMISLMLDNDANVNAVDLEGYYPIHSATRFGYPESVYLMLEKEADVNVKTVNAWTPLHMAVANGDLEMVKMMYEKGVDVNARTDKGSTILHIALKDCTALMVNLVIVIGVDPNTADYDGTLPLHLALQYATKDIVDLLLEQPNISVDELKQGLAHLKITILNKNLEKMKQMLKLEQSGSNIRDALEFAIQNNSTTEILNELDQAYLAVEKIKTWNIEDLIQIYRHVTIIPADVKNTLQSVDSFGQTLLHHAARLGIKSHVLFFLQEGANLNKADNNGVTPLQLLPAYPSLFDDVKECTADISQFENTEFNKFADWFKNMSKDLTKNLIVPIENLDTWQAEEVSHMRIPHRIAHWLGSNEINSKESHQEFQLVQECIGTVIEMLVAQMSEIDPLFKISPRLIGSASEGTKCGYPDQFDYICNLEKFTTNFQLPKDVVNGLDLKCLNLENKEMVEFCNSDGNLEVLKMAQAFNTILNKALKVPAFLEKLPSKVYIQHQEFDSSRMPALKVCWSGDIFKWLEVTVDLQPAIQIEIPEGRLRSLPVTSIDTNKYIYATPISQRNKYGDTLHISCAAAETRVFQVIEEDIRLGYILAKTFLNPAICPNIDIHLLDKPTKVKDYIFTYLLKTCFLYELVEATGDGEPIEKQGLEGEEYATNAERVLVWADRIYARLEFFLEQGFLPSYYTPEFDVMFGQVVMQGSEIANKLRNDTKLSQNRNIIYAYCDLIRNKIINA